MKLPSPVTLKKYGLSAEEWIVLYNKFGGRCHVCLKKYSAKATRNLHIDHEHVDGWKALLPEEKKRYVRGLACYSCNRFRLTKDTTRKTAKNLLRYLEEYESKKYKSIPSDIQKTN